MKAPIKKHVPAADAEPTVERDAAAKLAQGKGRIVDMADLHPGLGRRMLFREKRPEEVE